MQGVDLQNFAHTRPVLGISSDSRIYPYLLLIPVFFGIFIAADDQTVVVTILPEIIRDFKFTTYELDRASWTITGYLLGYIAAMPLIGSISDILGHRNMYIFCIIVFLIGSALVALSQSFYLLVAARIFQAVGAGALIPISIAIVGDLFPNNNRAIPLGILGACAEAGAVIGPLWGGLIIKVLDWEWAFWINIPLGFVVILGVYFFIQDNIRRTAPIDFIGGGLLIIFLSTLTLALSRISNLDSIMFYLLIACLISLLLFSLRISRFRNPLLPSEMFSSKVFNVVHLTHLVIGAALIISMVTLPLMANTLLNMTPLDGGLMLMRMTVAIPVGAVIGAIILKYYGHRTPIVIGLALTSFSFYLMSNWGLDYPNYETTLHLLVLGFGFGLVIAPISSAAIGAVRIELIGTAAATITAARIMGMTLGLASITAWGMSRYSELTYKINFSPMRHETFAESQNRIIEGITLSGLQLFQEFFLVASILCLIGMVFTIFMTERAQKL